MFNMFNMHVHMNIFTGYNTITVGKRNVFLAMFYSYFNHILMGVFCPLFLSAIAIVRVGVDYYLLAALFICKPIPAVPILISFMMMFCEQKTTMP